MNARVVLVAVMALGGVATLRAQTIQNPTLRRAQQAFDNLDYRQALSAGQAALRERLTGFERARDYELLGFTYSGMDSILKAVDAFKQVVLLEPERTLDPNRTSPKALSAFQVALTQVLVVRQLVVYTGIALAGTSALSNGDLGSASLREGGTIGAGIVLAGFIMTLKKPAPQPARGNILYNQLLRDQITRRNAEIAQENTRRRQQVALTVAALPRSSR